MLANTTKSPLAKRRRGEFIGGLSVKCIIDGIEVNAKITENLGYQGGAYRKAVEYQGQERIVTNIGGIWQTADPKSKLLIERTVCRACGVDVTSLSLFGMCATCQDDFDKKLDEIDRKYPI